MNADGTSVQRVTGPGGGFDPAWSPDGTEIVFVRQSDRLLSALRPDGTGERDLGLPATWGGGVHRPAWAPDGTRIAFDGLEIIAEPGNYSVFVVPPDGSGAYRDANACCQSADWSPDGRLFLLDDSQELASVEVSTHTYLTFYAVGSAAGVWSPDGSKIAFIQFGGDHPGLNVMNADGTGATQVVSFDRLRAHRGPDWQPIPGPRGAATTGTRRSSARPTATSWVTKPSPRSTAPTATEPTPTGSALAPTSGRFALTADVFGAPPCRPALQPAELHPQGRKRANDRPPRPCRVGSVRGALAYAALAAASV
jgi:Tol biopolymer transport system component